MTRWTIPGSWRIGPATWAIEPRIRHHDRIQWGAWQAPPSGRASTDAVWRVMPEPQRQALLGTARENLQSQGDPDPREDEVTGLARSVHSLLRWLRLDVTR